MPCPMKSKNTCEIPVFPQAPRALQLTSVRFRDSPASDGLRWHTKWSSFLVLIQCKRSQGQTARAAVTVQIQHIASAHLVQLKEASNKRGYGLETPEELENFHTLIEAFHSRPFVLQQIRVEREREPFGGFLRGEMLSVHEHEDDMMLAD
ncbi:hypothetical protein IRJ41_008010 [Triplophysa rosa]|uniref:Uncharacterized protein n=1 Tax=Triplophysa rosa TaxID=992332 RepID=A0A9W7WBX4_TRIRA|nr:hypothetical protein IRJ41_008010 [Triplophysa rosa]